jgi:hypothetical protein
MCWKAEWVEDDRVGLTRRPNVADVPVSTRCPSEELLHAG